MTTLTRVGADWGLEKLDQYVGPAYPGRLYVVGARPSNGKTRFLFNWLNRLYAKIESVPRRILCFWTERDADVAYRTWAALRLGLDEDTVLMDQWDQLPDGAEAAVKAELEIVRWESGIVFSPQTRPTVPEILKAVEDVAPEIVVLDYLQRIKPLPGQSKFDAISEAAVVLADLASKEELTVVVASQLKRRGDGVFDKYRPPFLEDFKLAGEIEEASDVALGLFRPLVKMSPSQEKAVRHGDLDLEPFKRPNTMAIKILKHRYRGPAADRLVRVKCDDVGRIYDFPEDRAARPTDAGDAYEADDDLPF
jgi:replicative DNA helicase